MFNQTICNDSIPWKAGKLFYHLLKCSLMKLVNRFPRSKTKKQWKEKVEMSHELWDEPDSSDFMQNAVIIFTKWIQISIDDTTGIKGVSGAKRNFWNEVMIKNRHWNTKTTTVIVTSTMCVQINKWIEIDSGDKMNWMLDIPLNRKRMNSFLSFVVYLSGNQMLSSALQLVVNHFLVCLIQKDIQTAFIFRIYGRKLPNNFSTFLYWIVVHSSIHLFELRAFVYRFGSFLYVVFSFFFWFHLLVFVLSCPTFFAYQTYKLETHKCIWYAIWDIVDANTWANIMNVLPTWYHWKCFRFSISFSIHFGLGQMSIFVLVLCHICNQCLNLLLWAPL